MYQCAIHSSISNHETFSMGISEFHYSSSSVAQGILSPCSSQLRLKINIIWKFCLCLLLAETREYIGVFSIVQICLWIENWCKMFCVYSQTAFYMLANKRMVARIIWSDKVICPLCESRIMPALASTKKPVSTFC